jgi:solute carrier family 25 carnitine/acylcarnitine transporter 20/29
MKENGWRSVWKGFGPCVSRAFPANAAGFLAYEIAAKLIRERQEEKDAAVAAAAAASN